MCCCRIFLTVFVIVQFLAVVFSILGTAFDVYRPDIDLLTNDTSCITLWGAKEKCFSGGIISSTNSLWQECPPRLSRFRAAQGMALLTVIFLTASLAAAFVQCCCCRTLMYVSVLLNFLAVITSIVVFSVVVDSWYKRRGPDYNLQCWAIGDIKADGHRVYQLGSSIPLFIVTFILAFVNMIFALLPC